MQRYAREGRREGKMGGKKKRVGREEDRRGKEGTWCEEDNNEMMQAIEEYKLSAMEW
jgi:hypothetical protein